MPIYEFTCEACSFCFEELMSNSASSPEACPKCGHSKVKKLMSAHAVGREASPSPCSGCDTGSCNPKGCPFS